MKWLDRLFFGSNYVDYMDRRKEYYRERSPNPEAQAFIREVISIIDNNKVTGGIGQQYPEYGKRYMVSMMEPHIPNMFSNDRCSVRSHLVVYTYKQDLSNSNDEYYFIRFNDELKDKKSMTVYEEDFEGIIDMYTLYGRVSSDGVLGELTTKLDSCIFK